MDGKWGRRGVLAVLLGVVVGCRTPPPVVKPEEQPEVLNKPPQEARFSSPWYPKEAFNRDDPSKRWKESLMDTNAVMPARGSFGGPSGGAMR